jgi:hypothetical protein
MPCSSLQDPVAFLCMGEFWCPEHCEYEAEDIEQGYVTPITEFDLMVGGELADMLPGSCCHGCGLEFAP